MNQDEFIGISEIHFFYNFCEIQKSGFRRKHFSAKSRFLDFAKKKYVCEIQKSGFRRKKICEIQKSGFRRKKISAKSSFLDFAKIMKKMKCL